MPYDPHLADQIRAALPALALREGETLGETKMFGGLCFTLNGKMLIGIDKSRFIIRINDEAYERELRAGRIAPMDLTGRPLRNFAFLLTADPLLDWIEISASFVREEMLGGPPKRKRSPKG